MVSTGAPLESVEATFSEEGSVFNPPPLLSLSDEQDVTIIEEISRARKRMATVSFLNKITSFRICSCYYNPETERYKEMVVKHEVSRNTGASFISHRFIVRARSSTSIAVFTNRLGGFSKPPYDELNLSPYVGDDHEAVNKNRRLVAALFESDDFISLNQVHGNEILDLKSLTDKYIRPEHLDIEADGVITDLKDIPFGVLTADCLPLILVCDSGFTAAIHAGWRGLKSGIVVRAVETLKERGEGSMVAILGPSIGSCCYSVGGELLSFAMKEFPDLIEERQGKYYFDLKGAAVTQLVSSGVKKKNIYVVDECTSCLRNLYYSYRVSNVTGRQAALVINV